MSDSEKSVENPSTADVRRAFREDGPFSTPEARKWTPTPHRFASKFGIESIGSGGHGYQTVWWVPGSHTKREVIEKFAAVNADRLNPKGAHQRIARNYPAFKEASRDVLDPFETGEDHPSYGREYRYEGTCPVCGETHTNQLAFHIRNDCEVVNG
jgi:hypothetical protein